MALGGQGRSPESGLRESPAVAATEGPTASAEVRGVGRAELCPLLRHKRHVAGANLGLLLRNWYGIGTPRSLQELSVALRFLSHWPHARAIAQPRLQPAHAPVRRHPSLVHPARSAITVSNGRSTTCSVFRIGPGRATKPWTAMPTFSSSPTSPLTSGSISCARNCNRRSGKSRDGRDRRFGPARRGCPVAARWRTFRCRFRHSRRIAMRDRALAARPRRHPQH